MPSVLWRSFCSLISHTFTNSQFWSFIIFSFPVRLRRSQLVCFASLFWGTDGDSTIPLLKGIHTAPSQSGSLHQKAEHDELLHRSRAPEKTPGSASHLEDASTWKGHCKQLGREKTENQNKSRLKMTLGISSSTFCTHQGAFQSQTTLLRTLRLPRAWGSNTCRGRRCSSCAVPLMYTHMHASKHNRSVFIQCD